MTLVIWGQEVTLVCTVSRGPRAKVDHLQVVDVTMPIWVLKAPLVAKVSMVSRCRRVIGMGFRCSIWTLKVSRGPGVEGPPQVVGITQLISGPREPSGPQEW